MSSDKQLTERIAHAFHDEYEAFAEVHGWETNKASRVSFDDLPEHNRLTMLDTIAALLDRGIIRAAGAGKDRLREALLSELSRRGVIGGDLVHMSVVRAALDAALATLDKESEER